MNATDLITQARSTHHASAYDPRVCAEDSDLHYEFPCLAARLADALEACKAEAERLMFERQAILEQWTADKKRLRARLDQSCGCV